MTHQPTGNSETLLRDLDLSKSGALRSLELTITNLKVSPSLTLTFLRNLLPTITSPVFSDVVIILREGTIQDMVFIQHVVFSTMRSLYEVKPFRLVFSLEIWEGDKENIVEMLKRCIDVETAKGGLDFLPCPPVIVSNTRAACSPTWEGSRV